MKISLANPLLIALGIIATPLASAQSSAPSALSPIESLAPSSADPVESLVPSAPEPIGTLSPSTAIPMPTKTIAQFVTDDERFATLEYLLIATGLLDDLKTDGPFTLFAPTDDAFKALNLPEKTAVNVIMNVVSYHVVSGEQIVLEDGEIYKTLNGGYVKLTVSETEQKVNNANISETALATNGVVYVIDTVLVPRRGENVGGPEVPSASPTSPQSSVPGPVESLSPSASESLAPTDVVDVEPAPTPAVIVPEPTLADSLAPSISEQVESSTPSFTEPLVSIREKVVELAPTPEVALPEPTTGAQTIEPTSADSLSPSASDQIESLTPSAGESLMPTITEDFEPTPGAATLEPTPASSAAPSDAELVESLAPSSTVLVETLTPSGTIPGVDPKCSAHPECLLEGLDGDCCPTSLGVFAECCALPPTPAPTPGVAAPEPTPSLTPEASAQPSSDSTFTNTVAPTGATGTGEPPLVGDPLEINEPPAVSLRPKGYPGCMTIDGEGKDDDDLILATCVSSNALQTFRFVPGGQIQIGTDSSKCLQAGRLGTPSHGNYLRVFPCDESNDLQIFTWEAPDGRLYPTNYPDVTVVFQGTTADVNNDQIILGGLNVGGVADREGWEIERTVL